jgi:hypothetical protein
LSEEQERNRGDGGSFIRESGMLLFFTFLFYRGDFVEEQSKGMKTMVDDEKER